MHYTHVGDTIHDDHYQCVKDLGTMSATAMPNCLDTV